MKVQLCWKTRLVGEEDAIMIALVVLSRVNPGVAEEVDSAVARDILQGDGPEVKLAVVLVSHENSPRQSDIVIATEYDPERRLPHKQLCDCIDPLFQICWLSNLPSMTLSYNQRYNYSKSY